MPELPEVETVCAALRIVLDGVVVKNCEVRNSSLREPVDVEALKNAVTNRRICEVRRRGKFIVWELGDTGEIPALVLHLGMSGRFHTEPPGTPYERHDHVCWMLDNGRELRFCDPRRFGSVRVTRLECPGANPPELAHLGPEPLGEMFNANSLFCELRKRKAPVKNLLLDQTLVAGIGNIYANEALYVARIHPLTPGDRLGKTRCARLVDAVKSVLADAIACGGTTIRDFQGLNGDEGHFATCLNVYGRDGETCPRCDAESGAKIHRVVSAGRSTYFCPKCQRK
jgi:formamidopyrimidine-DNA glycosylase